LLVDKSEETKNLTTDDPQQFMNALVKAGLYLGTVLLVGAGGYIHFVARPAKVSRGLVVSVSVGFALIVVGSVFNLALTVMNVLGRFDASFIWQYATSTQHGTMTFLRLGLAVLLIPLVLTRRWRRGSGLLFVLTGLGFLATFSASSHATTMRGSLAFTADLVHFSAASLWAGAVIFTALSLGSRASFGATENMMVKRVSSIGVVSVVLLVATGLYTSLIHINSFSLLMTSVYGRVLLLKLGVFSLILLVAALNRWYFMPQLVASQHTFQKVLLAEVVLLFVVLVTTGLLTVTALPHE
jgi:putative copper export protein